MLKMKIVLNSLDVLDVQIRYEY